MELRATMLNINKGHNKKLMDACRTLKDYAEYTALVREYARARPLAEAVEKAVDNCISRGVLAEFLKKNRQLHQPRCAGGVSEEKSYGGD